MNKIINSVFVICLLFFSWFAISYIEIATENTNKKPEYSEYNLIIMLSDYYDK